MNIHLKQILDSRKISITELSDMTGVSRSTLSNLCNSYILPPKTRFNTLDRICDKLNIPMNQLISFNDTGEEMFLIPISEYKRLKEAESQLNSIKEILGGGI